MIINDNTLLYMIDKESANKVYPVGSVFLTVEDTDPSTLFGGKWVQMADIGTIHAWQRTALSNRGI